MSLSANGTNGVDQDRVWLSVLAAGGRDAERALEGLFRKYRRALQAFLVQRGLDHGTAEDVIQEVFIRVVRSASTFRGEAQVSTWLFQIAKNLHLDHVRKANLEDTMDDDTWMMIEGSVSVAPACESQTTLEQALQDCFDNGFAEFAKAFPQPADVLHKVVRLNWDTRDVASFLERTEGATREYLSQCRKKLKRFLEPCQELLSQT